MIYSGKGSPEGSVTGIPGALYLQVDGALGAQLWQKQNGVGGSGWGLLSSAVSGVITVDDGSVLAPSIRFSLDTDTGFYRFDSGGSVVVALAIDGNSVLQVWKGSLNELIASGLTIAAGSGDATNPGYHFSGVASSGMFHDDGALDLCFSRLASVKIRVKATSVEIGNGVVASTLKVWGSQVSLNNDVAALFVPVSNAVGLKVLSSEVLRGDTDATAGFTRVSVYDNNAAGLQRLKVGANGTGPGGVGRAVYLDNV